jgi:hypothetical protein
VDSAAAVGAGGTLGVAAVGAPGAVACHPLGAFGAAGDGGDAPPGGEPALLVERDHRAVAERLDLLGAAQAHTLFGLGAARGGELVHVERHKHRFQGRQGRWGWLAGALAGGGDGALAHRFGVAGWHAKLMPLEGFTQRRPGRVQLLGGGVDAAELFGERECPLGLGAVGEEAAGLPAQRVVTVPAALLRSARSYERVLSEADVELYAATARWGCGRQPGAWRAPQRGGAWAG